MSAAKPLTFMERTGRYERQNSRLRLTPRQIRRIWHKEHRAWGREQAGKPVTR